MNRLIISIGAITILILVVVGIVAYMERVPTQNTSTSTATNGFNPLDRGSVNPSGITIPGQAQSIPYAQAPAPQPEYQPTIVTAAPNVFSQPFIQYVQPSPAFVQQIAFQQNQPEIVTAPPPPIEEPIQEPIDTTSTVPYIPATNIYIPYNGPSSTPATSIPTGGGGDSGDGGGSATGGIIAGLLGCLTGLITAGPYGCIIGGILGGLSGGGIISGSVGTIIGAVLGLASGNITSLLGGILGSGEQLVDIQDVRGQSISVLYEPGQSHLYAEHNISTGAEVIGTYSGITGEGNFGGRITNLTSCSCGSAAGQCMITSGDSCTTQGFSRGTIDKIGTSAN